MRQRTPSIAALAPSLPCRGAWERLHKGRREPFSRFRRDTDKVFEEEKAKQEAAGSQPWDVQD
jgi:hypothetical protein